MLQPRDLPLLPVFVEVARTGSFTKAGKQLRLAKSVVSAHVRTLEERVGVRLIERTTRRLHLTQIGQQVFDAASQVLASVRSLEQLVETHKAAPTGTLRVTMPLDPALSRLVAPIAADLARTYPSLRVDLVLDDGVHDLVDEGLDLALRLGTVAESSYVVRRLGTEPDVIVASDPVIATLMASGGDVDSPAALRSAPWVAHAALMTQSTLGFRSDSGDRQQISVDIRAKASTSLAVRDLILAGAGVGILPRHMVRDDLRDGRLRRLCADWFRRQLTLHVLLPTRKPPPRVRVFLAALGAAIEPLGFDPA